MKLWTSVARWVWLALIPVAGVVVAQDEDRESAPRAMNTDPMTAEPINVVPRQIIVPTALLFTAITKIWYWMLANRNSVKRDIRRLGERIEQLQAK